MTTSSRYRLTFAWKNSYGRARNAVVWADASGERAAIVAGREQLRELYGIERACFVSARIDD